MSQRRVTDSGLERRLGSLPEGPDDLPLFPSHSMVWKVGREALLILAGGRAALLQLAHPYVAEAVADHSMVFTDVQGRFHRTLRTVYDMTFGTRAQALDLAHKVHEIHRGVKGELRHPVGRFKKGGRYSARNIEAMYWVAATLWDSSILIFEKVLGPLTHAQKEQYFKETRHFCALFGIPDDAMPDSWSDFKVYFAKMLRSETIAVGPTAKSVAAQIMTPPRPAAEPLFQANRILTSGLMPDHLRQDFDLEDDVLTRLAFQGLLVGLKTTVPHLPDGVRYSPAYLRAIARSRGDDDIELLSRVFRELILALMKQRN